MIQCILTTIGTLLGVLLLKKAIDTVQFYLSLPDKIVTLEANVRYHEECATAARDSRDRARGSADQLEARLSDQTNLLHLARKELRGPQRAKFDAVMGKMPIR